MRALILILCNAVLWASPLAGQIRSTSTGGPWSEPSTWEGGEVPEATDDVILSSGAVIEVARGESCRTLMIEEGAMLHGQNLLNVEKRLTNRGAITSSVWVSGDIVSTGSWEGRLTLVGDGVRTVNVPEHTGSISVAFGNVLLKGSNVLARLDGISGGSSRGNLFVEPGATLRFTVVPDFDYQPDELGRRFERVNFEPQFVNRGTIILPNVPAGWSRVDGDQARGRFSPDNRPTDTLTVETHAMQAHPRFANAGRVWWRLTWSGETAESPPDFSSLRLFITRDQLGDLFPEDFTEESLHFSAEDLIVYHSADSGRTWVPVDEEGVSIEKDSTGFVLLGNIFSQGDYVIAPPDPPANARPSVSIRVMGREQIRIGGPPARYRFSYMNTSDVPVGRTLLGVKTDGGVYIDSIVPSFADDDDPASGDFWSVDLVSPGGDSTEALLMASPLAPRESRTFTAYLRAVPVDDDEDAGKLAAAPAVAGAIVMGVAAGYLTDFVSYAAEEFMADPCGQSSGIRDKFDTAFDRTDAEWNPLGSESPWQAAAENAAEETVSSGFVKRGIGVVSVLQNITSAASTVANGTDRYERRTGRSMWEPIECDPPDRPDDPRHLKDLRAVLSWDPNAKTGPDGVGDLKHISSAGRMEYTILFENKAEATAPAYRVVIHDSLSDVFDPETVRIGNSSHEGWTIAREGNVLTWDLEGIELPPNVNPPEGEGFVSFSVEPRPGLPSGAMLSNTSTIIFDLNDPITTDAHVNTLDFKAPITTMEPIPASIASDRVPLRWTSIDPDNGSGVASSVVFVSTDGGPFEELGVTADSSFEAVLEPDHSYAFYALAADRVGNAELSRPEFVQTELVATSTENEDPFVFALRPNYPNPFNPTTRIRYSLAETVHVRLVVFDALGRAVATLVDEPQPPGPHQVEISLPQLASGVYFYRIEAGSFIDNRTMVLVK